MPGSRATLPVRGLGCEAGVVVVAAAVARRSALSEAICSSMASKREIRAAVASPGLADKVSFSRFLGNEYQLGQGVLEWRLTLNYSSEMVPEERRQRRREENPRSQSQKMSAHDKVQDGCV